MKTDSDNTVKVVVDAIQDKKGVGITVIDMEKLDGAPSGKFIVCTGKSTSQTSAIADNVRDRLIEKCGRKPYHYDGYRNSQWIVLDYGEFMVHVFLPDVRSFYRLEELWNDADIEEVPDLD